MLGIFFSAFEWHEKGSHPMIEPNILTYEFDQVKIIVNQCFYHF